jgi:PAS domain S-box-containing protein
MNSSGLKVLLFEDDPLDIQLNINELKKENPDLEIRSTSREKELKIFIDEFSPDIILSDYNLPGFNGLDALNYVRDNYPLLPIIIVTGSLDEETAASCILKGAWDYVLKENIFRLNPAIKLALQHKAEKIKLKNSETKLKESKTKYEIIFNSVADGIFIYDPIDFKLLDVNDIVLKMYKYKKEEILKVSIGELSDVENGYTTTEAKVYAQRALSGKEQVAEWRAKDKNGKCFWIHVILKSISIDNKTLLMGIVRDIDSQKDTEYSLQKSQEHFRALTQNSPDVIMRFDRNHRHIFVNDAVKDMVGIDPSDFLNKTHREMQKFPDELIVFWESNIEKVFSQKKSNTVEFSIETNAGQVDVEWRLFPEFDEEKQVESVLAVARDVSENKLAEKKLRASEQRLQLVLDNIPQSIFWKDKNSIYLGCNIAFAKLAGIENPTEIVGKKDSDLPWTEEQVRFILEIDKRVVENNRAEYNILESLRISSDENAWINANKVPLHDEKGKVIGILGTAENITEKIEAQEALKGNEERLQIALEGTSDGLWDWDLEKESIYFSPRYFTMLDYHPNDFVHDIYVLSSLLHPEDKDRVLGEFESAIEEKSESIESEFRLKRKDGSFAWILSRGKLNFDEHGNTARMVGTHVDISLRKRQENIQNVLIEIANSVNNTRNLSELFLQIQKSLGNIIDTTNCYVALYDEKADTISLPFHQDEKDTFKEFPAGKTVTGYVIKTGKAQLVDLKRVDELEKTGEVEPIGAPSVSWLGVPLKIVDKIIGVFVVQSYTEEIQYTEDDVQLLEFVSDQIALAIERKIDQDKLKNNEIRQRRIIESSPDGLVVIDMNGRIVDYNSTFLELLRITEKECKENNFFELIADQDVIRVQNILNETLKSSYSKNFEFKMKKGGNSEFFTETSFGLIHGNEEHEGNFVIVIKNIDERKAYEYNLRIAKEKAEESDRLKTAFLSNMSHEIRTPMNAIIGFSDLLSRAVVRNEEKQEYITQINYAADTLMRLIDDIIDISKIEAGQLKMNYSIFSLKSLFDEIAPMFSKSLEQQNKTHIDLIEENITSAEEIQLHTDEFRLKQIFFNLLNNAVKFTSKGRICYGVKSISKNRITFFVKDTGVGIEPGKQKYIFDRFRQGHENKQVFYGGTGLGLTISKNLVSLMGGELNVFSELGEGSEFYFTLPYKEISVKVPEEVVKIDRSSQNWSNKTFLIAEDDTSNYFLLQENLKKFHVKIIWAKTGLEAVEKFKNHQDEIDVILMDVQMPELNGYEAAKLIKEIDPDIPVIAQTAYAMAGERDASLKAGCDDYISKPLIMNELIFILNKYLDRKFVND